LSNLFTDILWLKRINEMAVVQKGLQSSNIVWVVMLAERSDLSRFILSQYRET